MVKGLKPGRTLNRGCTLRLRYGPSRAFLPAAGLTDLQAIADEARVETAEAQVKTARALNDQASDQLKAGASPAIDTLRTRVELQTRQQQLIQVRNDFAVLKLKVARRNIDLAEQTLTQSRDRFSAGVTDSVEVVQSEEALASAHEQYITSLYNHDSAKLVLVRALGVAEEGVKKYFKGK